MSFEIEMEMLITYGLHLITVDIAIIVLSSCYMSVVIVVAVVAAQRIFVGWPLRAG